MTQQKASPLRASAGQAPISAGKAAIVAALDETRQRTWHLVAGLADQHLLSPACAYLSPPVWDLGHMANFEELWLVQRLAEASELHEGYNDTYDAFAHPRTERPRLELLDRDGCRAYMAEVRQRTLEVLRSLRLDGDRLVKDGFVHWMLVLHEHQHQETLLQSLQMRGAAGQYEPPPVRRLPAPRADRPGPDFVTVPAGAMTMGQSPGPGVYDNESPEHVVEVAEFEIGRYPVTCGEYLRFIEEGGYEDRSLWSARGRQWLSGRAEAGGTPTDPDGPRHDPAPGTSSEGHNAPLYWRHDPDHNGAWVRDGPGCTVSVVDWPDIILSHVTWFEAEAYARWAGVRLPTEAEWEKAARWHPATQSMIGRNPWGDAPATTDQANVDQLAFAPSRIGAYPTGASPVGAEHMIGDVWEWCSDGFTPYPDFAPFPYREYSEVFFGGDYRMLRGGSWATRPTCATGTFRNWDHPYRRQVFAGIRLVRGGR